MTTSIFAGVAEMPITPPVGVEMLEPHGTATLHAVGITTIRADAAVGKVPMAKAFRRTGYRQFGTRRWDQLNHTA